MVLDGMTPVVYCIYRLFRAICGIPPGHTGVIAHRYPLWDRMLRADRS